MYFWQQVQNFVTISAVEAQRALAQLQNLSEFLWGWRNILYLLFDKFDY